MKRWSNPAWICCMNPFFSRNYFEGCKNIDVFDLVLQFGKYWRTSLCSRQTKTIAEIFHALSKSRKLRSQSLQRGRAKASVLSVPKHALHFYGFSFAPQQQRTRMDRFARVFFLRTESRWKTEAILPERVAWINFFVSRPSTTIFSENKLATQNSKQRGFLVSMPIKLRRGDLWVAISGERLRGEIHAWHILGKSYPKSDVPYLPDFEIRSFFL